MKKKNNYDTTKNELLFLYDKTKIMSTIVLVVNIDCYTKTVKVKNTIPFNLLKRFTCAWKDLNEANYK